MFYKDNTVYPKFKGATKLYEGADEVDPSKYEDRCCDVKAVLEIGGILRNGDKTSLQMKSYEALVKEPEHVGLVPMAFKKKSFFVTWNGYKKLFFFFTSHFFLKNCVLNF